MAPAFGAAAVAATERLGSVLTAALLLPGVAPAARAETAPDRAEISVRWLTYQDRQPGLDRITVQAPAAALVLPLTERWSLDAGLTQDTVSGATPRWHSAVSGASVMADRRRAGDLRLNHHGDGRGWSLGGAVSDEDDYRSRSVSGEWREWSDDRNRTLTAGLALTLDRIGATGQPTLDERRRTLQLLLGVSQAWTARDLVSLTYTHAAARGYHSDPYKFLDLRPRERDRHTLLLTWNHHVPATAGTLRSSYRYYRDSFGIQAHTVEARWVQPVGEHFSLSPGLRLYTQRAAHFYRDPLPPGPGGLPPPPQRDPARLGEPFSADARLSGFGAVAVSVNGQWRFAPERWLDLRLEHYEQRGHWRVGGTGSPGLLPLKAWQWQLGLRARF